MADKYVIFSNLKQIPILLISLIFYFLSSFWPDTVETISLSFFSIVLGVWWLFLSGYAIFKSRNNKLLLLMFFFLFYFNYSTIVTVYFNIYDLPRNFYFNSSLTTIDLLHCGGICILFLQILIISINFKSTFDINLFKNISVQNSLIVLVCSIWCIISPIFFYNYNVSGVFGMRGNISPLYEYTIIFILLGLFYCGNNKNLIILIFLGSMFWCIHGVIFGERVAAFESLIIWITYFFLVKLKPIMLIIGAFCGLFFFSVVGAVRGIAALSGSSLNTVLEALIQSKFANDTSYFSYQASTVLYLFEGMVSFTERIIYFFKWLLYIVVGSSVENFNIAWEAVTGTGLVDNGGGWIMFYAHFWLSDVGVVLMAVYLGFLINQSQKHAMKTPFSACLFIYIVATSPRWYLYSPSSITRGLLIFGVMSLVFNFYNNLSKKYRKD